jgi:hypothetical protein
MEWRLAVRPPPQAARPLDSSRLLASLASSYSAVSHTAPMTSVAPQEEFTALIANNTWDLVPCPVGSNIVIGKWIFRHKFNSDESLEWYKACWVLRGFTQRPDVDYDETFSPVVKLAMICTVHSIVISRSYPVHHLDVNNAFLHNALSEIIYCSQPTGFVDHAQPDRVYLLNKSLYGLKQAPRDWYSRLTT